MQRNDLTFGGRAAWHYPAESNCCVVMGHGLGGTREGGLARYAERFQKAGLHSLVFDYLHFGDSQGEPRQLGSIPRQLQDWQAAVDYARKLPGVERIALWGTSFSSGHVLMTAARNPEIVAVIAQNPMVDGRAAFLQAARRVGPWLVLKTTLWALADALAGWVGRPPLTMPIAARPGELGFLTAPDSLPGYTALAPVYARNEVSARMALTTAGYRPNQVALHCPLLLQVCQHDSVAPVFSALELGRRLHAEVETYPIGHFDIYFGEHFERCVQSQVRFLRDHL
ncbi:MAG: alpha/beta hydrolase [Candidatus Eremiobacteraeota bacterium]|nr:alpha/beta hydrolase [Candidatus Eremiobacteraeota bacterium]MCW5872816.1 alpha/beta hydrolase [Candidatus Eremiobacteraeota bacterium]